MIDDAFSTFASDDGRKFGAARKDMANKGILAAAAIVVLGIIIAGLIELCAYLIIEVGGINPFLPLDLGQAVDSYDAESAGRNFSYELGWEPPSTSTHGYRGADKNVSDAALAVFGDSFTYAHPEIDKSWPELLEARLGQAVMNFGVRGYGTDQAYLRFRERYAGQLEAPYVALLVMSENIARTVNRYRGFYLRRRAVSTTKPRYILAASGQVEFLPNPVGTPTDMVRLWDEDFRKNIGQNDYWYRFFEDRGLNRVVGFPYSFYLIEALPYLLESAYRQRIRNFRWYEELYRKSEATAIMTFILERFVTEAEGTGAIPIVVFLPTWKDMVDHQEKGKTIYADYILDVTDRTGIEVVDALQYFIPLLDAGAAVPTFFISNKNRHYSPLGEQVIADGLFSQLEELEQTAGRLR